MAVAVETTCNYCINTRGFYCKSNGSRGRLQVYDFKGGSKTEIPAPIDKCKKYQAIYAQIDRGIWPVI